MFSNRNNPLGFLLQFSVGGFRLKWSRQTWLRKGETMSRQQIFMIVALCFVLIGTVAAGIPHEDASRVSWTFGAASELTS